jgi:thiol-disulfide isomerase/thioredoxin
MGQNSSKPNDATGAPAAAPGVNSSNNCTTFQKITGQCPKNEDKQPPSSENQNNNQPLPIQQQPTTGGNHNKVIVVKLWADWCGHCKAFEPEWKQLVDHYSKNPNVIFEHLEQKAIETGEMAKLTRKYNNRIKTPEGFPTFYIFRSSDSKKQHPYNGERSFDGMKKEIEKLLMHGHKGSHNQTMKTGGGAKKGKRKTMHRKRH